MKIFGLLAALAAAASCASAPAQTVYRCGNEYTRVPCKEGRAIETQNTATADQRAEAERTAARERALGDRMERDRLRAEREHPPKLASSLGPVKAEPAPPSPHASKAKKKRAKAHPATESDDFIARAPKEAKAGAKAK